MYSRLARGEFHAENVAKPNGPPRAQQPGSRSRVAPQGQPDKTRSGSRGPLCQPNPAPDFDSCNLNAFSRHVVQIIQVIVESLIQMSTGTNSLLSMKTCVFGERIKALKVGIKCRPAKFDFLFFEPLPATMIYYRKVKRQEFCVGDR